MRHVLTIAGSDSCGGAGIQADLKTFAALGVYGMSVITAVTAQNTCGVSGVQEISQEIVAAQIDAIFSDIRIDAVKIGMVFSTGIINTIAAGLDKYSVSNVVLDPVMFAKSGDALLQSSARQALIKELIPRSLVVTPNIPEAKAITGINIKDIDDMKQAALVIHQMGALNVLVKGGHLTTDSIDVLYDGTEFTSFDSLRIETVNTHGTGCTFSSAIAVGLAKHLSLTDAVRAAKEYITMAITHSFAIGKGCGPTHHFHTYYSNHDQQEETSK
ncbi:MAG: bifunctional hydroxymethylpyrimidine kinase/phosphomethylpyrimidine kinase [Acidobacteriota bacterium]